jgi:Tfp pilus assembly protein PilO
MKKKLAALNLKVQIGLVVAGLLVFAVGGYMLVISPKQAQASQVRAQVDSEQTQIYQRRAQVRQDQHPPTIQTADLFRLARAMPDREDMPGIILTLSQVARSAGIRFDLIEPVVNGTPVGIAGPFQSERIHLLFNGDFYGLSDFLYRVRSLVAVHDGKLEASGRLFNVDTVTFNVTGNTFPRISAELFVDAYVYSSSATPTTTPSTTPGTTTPTTTTPAGSTDTSLPADANAAGATP